MLIFGLHCWACGYFFKPQPLLTEKAIFATSVYNCDGRFYMHFVLLDFKVVVFFLSLVIDRLPPKFCYLLIVAPPFLPGKKKKKKREQLLKITSNCAAVLDFYIQRNLGGCTAELSVRRRVR